MKLQNFILIILIASVFACNQTPTAVIYETTKNYPEELQQLHHNVITYVLNDSVKGEHVQELLDAMQADGTWANIDYTSKERGGWPARDHVANLLEITKAYQTLGTHFYQQKEVSNKIHLSLDYWLENDLICPNWWYPEIGIPKILNPILLLMEPELSEQQLLKAMPILKRSEIGRTGQNKVWQSGNVLYTSLLERDIEMVKKAAASIKEELVVSSGEGVQVDGSYHQHGPQLQFGNYGLSYVSDMIQWITILRKTPFAFDEDKVSILRNYMLDGQQWVTWKNQYDISASGRQLFPNSIEEKAKGISHSFEKMEKLDPQYASEYQTANNYKSLSGNKHFWRSDFQVKRSPECYFSVKMNSNRVIGAESCNSENVQGFYMGDGVTFLYQSGDEYRNIFPFWDWKKIPGTTIQQDDEVLPVLTASGYRIESDFVGGVSNGEIGIAAMSYIRNGLRAHKSWFMLDELIVCLGAGINSNTDLTTTTSVNQSYLQGDVIVKSQSNVYKAESKQDLENPTWVLHDNIGYYFPKGGSLKLEASEVEGAWHWVAMRYPEEIIKADIFKLWFDHGRRPKDETYNYVLVPNASKTKLEEMESQFPFNFTNRKNRQEVASIDGSFVGVVFYEQGKSDVLGGIEVDNPCLVLMKRNGDNLELSVSDPTQQLKELNLIIQGEYKGDFATNVSGKTMVKVVLPDEDNKGKTVTVKLVNQ